MARIKSAKIYLRNGGQICDFMWATVMEDGSVLVGVRYEGTESLKLILDGSPEGIRPPAVESKPNVRPFKISFHSTGKYKLSLETALPGRPFDRCTVIGPPLAEIDAPRRMLEILIPNQHLKPASAALTDRDILLDATEIADRPLRCSVFCMSKGAFEGLDLGPSSTVQGAQARSVSRTGGLVGL